MITLTELVLLTFCNVSILLIWFYSKILENVRFFFEAKVIESGSWWAYLFTCPLCLSFHISWITLSIYLLPNLLFPVDVPKLHHWLIDLVYFTFSVFSIHGATCSVFYFVFHKDS